MQIDKMTKEELAGSPSALALPQVLDYLGRVAVQDACAMLCSENQELRKAAAANKVIQFMLEQPLMRQDVLAWQTESGLSDGCIRLVRLHHMIVTLH